MHRKRWLYLLVLCALLPRPIHAVDESSATLDSPGMQDSEETEGRDVIPSDARVNQSSEPVTPISAYEQKSPYDTAKNSLIHALDLWNAGHAEAASDAALEAYDDYTYVHRVPGVKRTKIREEMHQAAALYIESGIKTVKIYLDDAGRNTETIEEAKERLGDMHEVARDYHELNKMLNSAIDEIDKSAPHPATE